MLLEHCVAFVTGAASGIGAAGTRAMAREGARVVVTDRDGAGAEAIRAAGGQAEALALDVTDTAALRAAIAATAERHGRLDVLHSHAGVQVDGKLEAVTVEQLDLSRRLNLRAHFVAAQAAVGPMRRQGGAASSPPPRTGACNTTAR